MCDSKLWSRTTMRPKALQTHMTSNRKGQPQKSWGDTGSSQWCISLWVCLIPDIQIFLMTKAVFLLIVSYQRWCPSFPGSIGCFFSKALHVWHEACVLPGRTKGSVQLAGGVRHLESAWHSMAMLDSLENGLSSNQDGFAHVAPPCLSGTLLFHTLVKVPMKTWINCPLAAGKTDQGQKNCYHHLQDKALATPAWLVWFWMIGIHGWVPTQAFTLSSCRIVTVKSSMFLCVSYHSCDDWSHDWSWTYYSYSHSVVLTATFGEITLFSSACGATKV